jgi:hypothetical protein
MDGRTCRHVGHAWRTEREGFQGDPISGMTYVLHRRCAVCGKTASVRLSALEARAYLRQRDAARRLLDHPGPFPF